MKPIHCRAYAKINLTLDVGQRRADGYHDIRSIMQTIALHDLLTVKPTPDVPGARLEVIGDEADGVPADESNLVHKAAVRMQKIAAARGQIAGNLSGVQIILRKQIPSQAGLGGGSSDAAAILTALNTLFGLNLSHARLTEIGAALGADVPFFLTGGTALAEGLGEKITPLPALVPDCLLVIVKPSVGVSTAAAYGAIDTAGERSTGQSTLRWLRGEQVMHNDFEAVILPTSQEINAAYALLLQTAEAGESFKPMLCGSGAALFLRVSSPSAAEAIVATLRNADIGKVWITQTVGVEEK